MAGNKISYRQIIKKVYGPDSNTLGVQHPLDPVEEQLSDDDADVNNILTFSEDINAVEIWHNETGLEEFEVNGLSLKIGPGGWRSAIGGTASSEVEIPDGVECTVTRLGG